MNKFCPLRAAFAIACCKEKCAWYLVHSKQCAIPLIASRLSDVAKIIQEPTAVNIGPPIDRKSVV